MLIQSHFVIFMTLHNTRLNKNQHTAITLLWNVDAKKKRQIIIQYANRCKREDQLQYSQQILQ